jgi:hypothetical protein
LNDSFLEDLGSTNGTLVNGQPIKKHFLQNNDVVELGKYKLKYVTEATATQASPAEFEKTMVLRAPVTKPEQGKAEVTASAAKNFGDTVVNPETMQTQGSGLREAARQAATVGGAAAGAPSVAAPSAVASGPAPALQPSAVAPATSTTTTTGATTPLSAGAQIQGTIQILSGPSAGKELPLSKPLTTLGKPGVQVAVIAKRPQGYFITHVEGAAFPVVNGKQLDAQAHALNDHDVIELAGVKMEFYLKPG